MIYHLSFLKIKHGQVLRCYDQMFGHVSSVPAGLGVKPVPAGSHGGRVGAYESAQTTGRAEPRGRYAVTN